MINLHKNFFCRQWFVRMVALSSLMISGPAFAFCVVNNTGVELYGRSLDSGSFHHSIGAGQKLCCDTPQCAPKNNTALLLIVTNYVPVGRGSQPGWRAECRVKTSATGVVRVVGDVAKIACSSSAP